MQVCAYPTWTQSLKRPWESTHQHLCMFCVHICMCLVNSEANELNQRTKMPLAVNSPEISPLCTEITAKYSVTFWYFLTMSWYIGRTLILTPSLYRYCDADIELENYTVPKGADVYIPVFLVHKNPEYWPQPQRFNPQRCAIMSYTTVFMYGHTQLWELPCCGTCR